MKKKYILFVFVVIASVIFTGCFNFVNTNLNNQTTSNQTQNTTTNIDQSVSMPKSTNSIYQIPQSVPENATPTEIVNAYIDCVVTVFVVNFNDVELSFGSGICVYSGGYILTNNHVVESVLSNPTYELRVCTNGESSSYYAEVLWTDKNLDIAIIQCQNGDIPYVEISDRLIESSNPLQLLEPVIAIGTPLDYSLQNSCTYGYISGLNRYTTSDGDVYEQLIQHTASISNGNSGGPLFDMYGNLIGLNTLGSIDGNDIYFAVPVYAAQVILDKVVKLNEKEPRQTFNLPQLGITLCDKIMCLVYEQPYIDKDGVCVMSVTVGGNSYSKLQVGDIITSIDIGSLNYSIICRNDLIYALMLAENSESIIINFQRNNKSQSVKITLI